MKDESFVKWDAIESVEMDLRWRSLFRGCGAEGEEGILGGTSEVLVDSERSRRRLYSPSGAVDGRPERLEGEGGVSVNGVVGLGGYWRRCWFADSCAASWLTR